MGLSPPQPEPGRVKRADQVIAPAPAEPLEEPGTPQSRYLAALAQGHGVSRAIDISGISGADMVIARRDDPEFAALELALAQSSIRGRRPELARALLAHGTLGAVLRLVRDGQEAPHARDRIAANVQVLAHGPLAPRQGGTSTLVLQAQQIALVMQELSPEQLAALAGLGAQAGEQGPNRST